jgi:transposase
MLTPALDLQEMANLGPPGQKRTPSIPADKKADAERLRTEGKSYRDIAAELEVSLGTVSNWLSPKKPQ